ncbi:MAG: MATE family efflux transporter [Eubacteriales bacterium]|nr:MATE family efflux transporter [Eubacteriales bacterium]
MRLNFLRSDVDMLHAPLIPSVLKFAIPLMLSGLLQILFNVADMAVVGRFSGATALAAVGSTGSLTALFTNFFIGLSVGTGVVVARAFGSGDRDAIKKSVHTSVAVSAISGLIVCVIGLFGARGMLQLMDSPPDVIDQATLYMRIIFVGMPFSMMYNFAAAILRSVGDSNRPTIYLTIGGVLNVVLNMIFVIVFKMGVAGVAWATVISQALSFGLALNNLLHTDRVIKLDLKKLSIDLPTFKDLVKIGLPAGLQSTLFAISNVLIQSSVNSFQSTVMAGNSAAGNIDNFAYVLNNAIYQSAVTFCSQNVGAKQKWRIRPIARTCLGMNLILGGLTCVLLMVFNKPLLGLYTSDPAVIEIGILRMSIITLFIPVCGMMDAMVGILRGMGYSIMPMIVSLMGACVFRVVWIMTIFQQFHSLQVLYASYPISWTLTFAVHFACYWAALHKPQWKEAFEGGRILRRKTA